MQENERRLLHWSRRGRWGPTEQHSFAGEGEKCEILVCSSFFIGFHSFSSSVVWSIGGGEPTILQKFKGERQDRNTLGQSNINYRELICIEDPCLIFFQNMCISPTSSPIQMEVGCMYQQDKNKYTQYCSFTLVQTGIVEQGFQSPLWVAMKFARLTICLKKGPKARHAAAKSAKLGWGHKQVNTQWGNQSIWRTIAAMNNMAKSIISAAPVSDQERDTYHEVLPFSFDPAGSGQSNGWFLLTGRGGGRAAHPEDDPVRQGFVGTSVQRAEQWSSQGIFPDRSTLGCFWSRWSM